MKKLFTTILLLVAITGLRGQSAPEILYCKFDGSGTTIPNEATNPPTGTATATVVGGLSQGSTGLCGGALIGVGGSSSSNYVNTGWNTNLGNSPWTISFWTNNIPSSTTLFYQFGDASANSFRCFNNGVAGAGNWMLRGPVTDVLCTGCAPVGNVPSMTTFVYDPTLGNIKAYHNGVLNNTVSQSTLSISGASFTVGGQGGSTGMGSGQLMDEFRFYNRALDANEVALVWNQCLPLTFAPNDAAITAIEEPSNFCADTLDVVVNLRNDGTAQLTSATINWTLNGITQTPVNFTGLLDTLNGTGTRDTAITLGSRYFAANTPYDIVAWATMPNGVVDTVNYNDTSSATVQAAISGTFQIGGPGADYTGFSDAVADLNAFGVCGPVVFNVYDSTYVEQVSLSDIPGTSAINTITFQPLSGRPELIWAAFTSTENYTLSLSGADWITFRGLYVRNDGTTYGTALSVTGGSNDNTFEDNWFVSDTTPTTTSTFMCVVHSPGDVDTNNVFRGNTFRGGSYGLRGYGSSATVQEAGNLFEDNEFVENYYYGSSLYYQDGLNFMGNHFIGNTPYTGSVYRYYFFECDGDLVVANNTATGDQYGYGLYLSGCDGRSVSHGKVYNNMIRVGNTLTTSTSYGLYVNNCGYQDFYHNSILVTSQSTFSRAAYFTSGGGNELVNNNLVASDQGYAIYLLSQYSLTNADFNNLYAPNGNVGYFDNLDRATLLDYQLASGLEANSISVDPLFYSVDDLHVCAENLNGAGTPGWAMMDIDGQPRDAVTPDIGADEFSPISTFSLGPDTTLCTGDSLWLETYAGPSDTVLWNTGSTNSGIWVTSTGNYSVSVLSACGSALDAISVTQSALTYSGFLEADTNDVCVGDTITLSSTQSANTYSWSPGGTTSSTLAVTASGTYTLDISDGCGSGSESVTLTFNPAPTADFTIFTSYLTAIFTYTGSASGNPVYSWDFGDGSGTSSLASPGYVYATDGNYVVTLTVSNECGTHTYSDTVFINTVGMEEPEVSQEVTLYPNPSTGDFFIQMDLPGLNDMRLRVLDLQGKAIYTGPMETVSGSVKRKVELAHPVAGVYLVEIEVNKAKTIRKIVFN